MERRKCTGYLASSLPHPDNLNSALYELFLMWVTLTGAGGNFFELMQTKPLITLGQTLLVPSGVG